MTARTDTPRRMVLAAVKAHHFAYGTVATVDDLLPRLPGMTRTQVKAALVGLANAGEIRRGKAPKAGDQS